MRRDEAIAARKKELAELEAAVEEGRKLVADA
jgi:hypothetical protein